MGQGFQANSDLIQSQRDKDIARIGWLQRQLVRRYTDDRHNMAQADRDRYEAELARLEARVRWGR